MAVTSAAVDSTARVGSNGTTSTVAGVTFGTAAADRVIVVAIFTASGDKPNSATIGGVSATVSGTATAMIYLLSAIVPTGTSGSVTATFSSADIIATEGVIALTGAGSATPSDTLSVASNTGQIDVAAGGCIVAFTSASGAGSWTGVTSKIAIPAEGTFTGTFENSGGALTNRTVAYSTGLSLVAAAFDAAGGGGGGKTLAADSASYAWSGTAATLKRARKLAANSASYSWSGTAATLRRGLKLPAAGASYAWSGTAATLRANRDLETNAATYTWNGTAASLERGYEIATDAATYSWSGTAATLRANRDLPTDAASFLWSGTAVTLRANRDLETSAASFTWSGTDVTLTKSASDKTLATDSATYSWSTTAATLRANRDLPTDSASFAWSGTASSLELGRSIAIDSATFTWSGTAASLEHGREIAADAGSWLWSGTDAGLIKSGNKVLDAGAASWLWSGTGVTLTIASAQTLDGSGRGKARRDNYSPFRIYSPKELERLLREEEEAKKPPKTETAIPLGLSQIPLAAQAPVIAPQKPHIGAVDLGVAAMMKAKAEYDDDEESAALLL